MSSGGKRTGAGRPQGTGKFGVPTTAMRVPTHMLDEVREFVAQGKQTCPLYAGHVKAGFPVEVEDYAEAQLDLHNYLVAHPASTFFLRVSGDSMIDAGIFNGDLLVVDRSLKPESGKIVIASVNGELTVKRLEKIGNRVLLVAENPHYPPIELAEYDHVHIWGVVLYTIHALAAR